MQIRPGETSSTWEIDQSTTTTALLKAGLCSPPANSPVWQRLGLRPNSHSPDACWRGQPLLLLLYTFSPHPGQGYGECRASLGSVNYPGLANCPWWHGTFPASLLTSILPTSSPIFRMAAEYGLLHPSSSISGKRRGLSQTLAKSH